MSKDSHDELSELLDSFQNDDTMEKKIEDFAKKKERRTRASRTMEDLLVKPEPASKPVEKEERIVLRRETETSPAADAGNGETMVFSKEKIEEDIAEPSHTVIMDNQEIQTLIDENKGPQLHRESQPQTRVRPGKKKSDKKMIAIIAGSVVGVLLIGGIVFGMMNLISGSLNTKETASAQQENAFKDLKKFIDGLGDDTQGLTGYEATYSKLSAAQKAQINDLLKQKTGKTFDELIKELKSQKIEDSKNNNTQIAEKKAALKDQINQLKSQLGQAQSAASEANNILSRAQLDMNEAEKNRASAASALEQAQNDYNAAQQEAQNELNEKIAQIQEKIAELSSEDYSDETSNKLAELHHELDALNAQGVTVDASALNAAQNAYSNADAAYNNAASAYQTASSNASAAQAEVDSLNGQISSLQNELNALK